MKLPDFIKIGNEVIVDDEGSVGTYLISDIICPLKDSFPDLEVIWFRFTSRNNCDEPHLGLQTCDYGKTWRAYEVS